MRPNRESKILKTFSEAKINDKTLRPQDSSEDSEIEAISFAKCNGCDSEGKGNVDLREVNLIISFKCL